MSQSLSHGAGIGGGVDAQVVLRFVAGVVGLRDDGVLTPSYAMLQRHCVEQVLRGAGIGDGAGDGSWGANMVGCQRVAEIAGGVRGWSGGGEEQCGRGICDVAEVDGLVAVVGGCGVAEQVSLDIHSGGDGASVVESGNVTCVAGGTGVESDKVRVGSVVDGCDTSTGISEFGHECGPQVVQNVTPPASAVGCCASGIVELKGKHYVKNKAKREKRKRMLGDWRAGAVAPEANVRKVRVVGSTGGAVEQSDVATVCTVDSRTAVEIAAANSLAARRVAENEVAAELARHKLKALRDKSRTEAVNRLAAARYEQRINEAMAKSQSSFKKCDRSLKSLGSSGSAGEFALKQEVKKAKDNEVLRLYVEAQLKLAMKYASPDVHQMIAAMPPPVLQDEFEAFGECPSEYDEEEQEAYFDELNRRNEENFDKCATYC